MNLNIIFCVIICCAKQIYSEKFYNDMLKNYSEFFNFGNKKHSKINLENSVLKSKIDILGQVFKVNIDAVKANSKKLDLIFLIDASSSIGENNFQNELKFVRKLLSDVTVDYNHSRVAVITYSSINKVIVDVDEISEPKEENNKCLLLNNQITEIKYTGGATYTLGAFQTAQEIFAKARNDSKKVLFLITDGFSNAGDPIPVARELKKEKVIIFTIGISNGNYKELYELSSSPGEFHSYLLDSFDEFENLARRALHVDLQSGDYIPLGTSKPCDKLCLNGSCCDSKAVCTCGTSTGHYSCICQPGYYGSGLINSCKPCPVGSYSNGPNSCLRCPDRHHTTIPPAISIEDCQCKDGYQSRSNFQCEAHQCPTLSPPQHGYFVKDRACANVLNSACGVRCEVGYSLEGSSIRLCQTNATWSGQTPSCQVKTCEALLPPAHGSITCQHFDLEKTYFGEKELPVDTVCSFGCEHGRTLVGSRQRTCLPLAQWDGLKTSCKQLKCNRLSQIQFGKIEPSSCMIGKQEYGKMCSFSCEKGFEIIGPRKVTCTGLHGTWNNKIETRCKDITKPNLKCPDNVKGETLPGKNVGSVYWNVPNVTDNSGLNVTIWTKPSIRNITNFKFKIGTTNITYLAQDVFKNIAKCYFIVEIYDEEIPTIENCINPPPFLTTDKTGANVTWDEPNIFDNSHIFKVERSHDFGFFKIGTTPVTYTAVDLSNNRNTCTMNITVEETHCEPLPDPIYGHSNCTSSDDGIQCVITCLEGYALPITSLPNTIDIDNSATQFVCHDYEPIWYSSDHQIFPECSVTELPVEIAENSTLIMEPENATEICNDARELNKFNSNVKQDLEDNLEEACNDIVCTIDTQTECDEFYESENEEETNIIKREIQSPSTKELKKKPKKLRKRKRVKVNLQVISKNKIGKKKPLNKVRKRMRNIKFLNGNNVTTIYFDTPKIVCPLGCITRRDKCVRCPSGTFHNATKNTCQHCPIGYYNNKQAQLSCSTCPKNFSTRKLRTKSISECVEQCPPGTYARKRKIKSPKGHPNSVIERITLKPYCRPCPIGEYQQEFGKLFCKLCPKGYTTSTIRSTSINYCIPTIQEICSNVTICNNGQCVVENDFYYSCKCNEQYIGSHCETKITICSYNPCLNGGTCIPKKHQETSESICVCPEGYIGQNCQSVVETCSLNCLNNGTCVQNEEEEFCVCPKGYGGDLCDIKIQYCRKNICNNNGKCNEDDGSFRCLCKDGYIGRRCNILPCDYKPCPINSNCINTGKFNSTKNNFTCKCMDGYKGINCSEKIDYCESNTCLNNATCESLDTSYNCQCKPPFYGKYCENKWNSKYLLNFPKAGVSDFVRMEGFDKNLTEISMCLWMSTIDNFNYGTILSYATREFDNAFTITDYAGLVIYINNKSTITDIKLNDGFWHYFCFTWESKTGNYVIYLDGKSRDNGTNFAKGDTISGDGKMIIGQEQDIMGGKFSESESFLGKIAHFEVWSKVLQSNQVDLYMNSCENEYFGDIYSWPEIQLYINGDVKIENTSFCGLCKEPEPLYQGLIEMIDNVAYYKCNKGYLISEPSYTKGRKCTKAAKWEGNTIPYCKAVYCGYPGYFRHGNIIGRRYSYLDKIVYTCKDDYNLIGNSTRTCSEDGTWKPAEPKCLGIQCKAFKIPANSKIIIFSDYSDEFLEDAQNFEISTSIEIICTGTAKLVGEDILTCENTGEWDFPVPECINEKPDSPILLCSADHIPDPPPNGYVIEETLNAFNNGTRNTIEYKCKNGYRIKGDNVTTCILDGYWTQPNTSCDPVKCGNIPRIKYMKLTSEITNKEHHFGNIISFECTDGYRVIGNPTLRCLITGKWTRIQGKCIKKSCGKPSILETTVIEGKSYLFGDAITLVCENDKRYILNCSNSGEWIGEKGEEC